MHKPLSLAAFGLLLTAIPVHAQMSLPGKFEVTDTGSASYTIPISVVPGTAGLEPKLSLQYDSRSGNGLLGVGWSLAGLPAITRCGRTIAQDGQVGGVGYDANDRFCLDGQRLVAVSGSYGADQTEYRTERESFSKVVSYGQAGSGPSHFKVWTKAGLVMEFGNSADSRIEAQGKQSVRVWALNKTSDTKSNYFTVSYLEDNANGEYRPDRIDYTGNATANTPPQNSVRFVYETRPDITPLYQAGSLIKTTQRMTKVQAWQGGGLAREYRLVFGLGSFVQQSRMSELRLCAASNDCQPSTSIAYQAGQYVAGVVASNEGAYSNILSGFRRYLADFDGDGKTDIFWDATDTVGRSNGNRFLCLSGGDGQCQMVGGNIGYNSWVGFRPHIADFNGDGKADILWDYEYPDNGLPGGLRWLWLSNGDGTFSHIENFGSQNNNLIGYRVELGDFNGDGKADVFWETRDSIGRSTGSRWLCIGDGAGGCAMHGNIGFNSWVGYRMYTGDFNGDGMMDIFWDSETPEGLQSGGRWIWVSNGDGTFRNIQNAGNQNGNFQGYRPRLGDFNGDGVTDIMWDAVDSVGRTLGTQWVCLMKGDGACQMHNSGISAFVGYRPYFGDFNGDRKADILWDGEDASGTPYGNRWLQIGNGDGTFVNIQNVAGQNGSLSNHKPLLADINGDGRTDVFWALEDTYGRHTGGRWLALSDMTEPNLLMQVLVGNNATTLANYSALSSGGTLFSRDSGASACAYPCVDVQGPLYVVSEVKSSNGLGGEYRSTYRYAGAKSDQHGRGFLGFRQMTVRDEQTGVEQVTAYRQDYPFTGLVASREKKLGAQLLNRSSNTYDATNLGGTRRYPFLTTSLEESWELSGAALPAVTTGYQYDAWGNATLVSVSTGDGHGKTTTNTYANETASWLLGRLQRSVVTSTTPGN